MECLRACLAGGEPPGEPAKVPLCADVGPWAQQDIEALLLCQRQVSLQVSKALPVVLAWEWLVQVPGYVHLGNKIAVGMLVDSYFPHSVQ